MRHLNEQLRSERNRAFMARVSVLAGPPSEPPKTSELSQRAVKVLVKAALEVDITLLAIYEALGFHPAEGKAAIDELLAKGCVQLHRLPKGRGGQPTVVQILPPGRAELEKRGIVPAARKVKRGGFLHDVYARRIERWAKAEGHRYWFERKLGDKSFDFVYEDDGGKLRAIEICLTGSVEWTAQQMLKAAGVEGITQVICACARTAFLKSIKDQVRKLNPLGLYRGKITGKLLSDYL